MNFVATTLDFLVQSKNLQSPWVNPPGPVEKMAFGGGIGASQVWFDCQLNMRAVGAVKSVETDEQVLKMINITRCQRMVKVFLRDFTG